MPSNERQKVIELSVEETNQLRFKLGLAPLRDHGVEQKTDAGKDGENNTENPGEEVLELSVDATNQLRKRLGLPPLRNSSNNDSSKVQHVPASSMEETRAAQERIETAKLKRQVQDNIQTQFAGTTLGDADASTAQSWAQQMLQKKQQPPQKKKKESSTKRNSKRKQPPESSSSYTEQDLKGMNVGHSVTELETGAETVLTLADAPILLKNTDDDTIEKKKIRLNEDEEILQNINLAQEKEIEKGLREKRKVELGMGRAGGYSGGLDDDEFAELGGTQAPSRLARGTMLSSSSASQPQHASIPPARRRGFQIGNMLEEQDADMENDLFAGMSGQAVSLEPASADVTASDFMTAAEQQQQEEEAENAKKKASNKKSSSRKKKFKKDKKKKKKKRKTNHRRTTGESDEDDDNDQDDIGEIHLPIKKKMKKGLLEELEETAVESVSAVIRPRRDEDDDDDNNNGDDKGPALDVSADIDTAVELKNRDKRSQYNKVMAKGNERSRQAFGETSTTSTAGLGGDDEEPDDAFLNAALAKARRLNRLKEMSERKKKQAADTVVVAALQQQPQQRHTPSGESSSSSDKGAKNTITFSVDETREFTRALRARTEQAEREQQARRKKVKKEEKAEDESEDRMQVDDSKGTEIASPKVSTAKLELPEVEKEEEDIHELAKQVKEEDSATAGLEGTGKSVPVGRGVGNVLNLLKQTGDLTRKNAGKELMRGRAKDERTYEDYESLDLKQVVRIDERTATDKDRELANREVKLEYRDKHGRLLTRKEAFRELSYQFHGYGSGKRKEEKKLEQIAREQAEARLASRQAAEGAAAGTFGALKETQKATGKAFVIHKTGT